MASQVDELLNLLEGAGARMGVQLESASDEVRHYIATRVEFLAQVVDDPDYMEILMTERDNVALKIGLEAVASADAADRELIGIISGALGILARAAA